MIKLVKNPQGEVIAYGGHEGYEPTVPDGSTLEEVETYNHVESKQQTIARLEAELDAIERAEIMPRKTREIQIQLMEFLAVQQGIAPQQLALNPAYAGMKEIDARCAELRAQIRALL